jgi:3',5'-cyclic AMP phosphodiesterase CpdA
MMRVVQISDTHLLPDAEVVRENFELAAEYVNRLRPDLVVHTGDAIGLDPDSADERSFAAGCLATIDAPLRVLPGNHDVGETGPAAWLGFHATSDRVRAHRRAFDGDRFVETFDGWTIVGLNSEMLGSGIPEEDEQWAWLDDTLAASKGDRIVLFQHKPAWRPRGHPPDALVSIPVASRNRLLRAFRGRRLVAIGTGHLHQPRQHTRGALLELWGPSTSFVPDSHRSSVGVVEWRFHRDRVEASLHEPPGLTAQKFRAVPEFAARLAELERTR